MNRFMYLKAFCSPFKRPSLRWYFGKIAIGVPYFLPRKWVKPTHQMAVEAAMEELARREKWNNANPDAQFKQNIIPLDEMYKEKLQYLFPVPRKIGFDHCSLGYKTKWSSTDYRYEYSPVLSFVFFKWQIAVTVWTPHPDCYWTAFLFYNYKTKGTKRERIEQCKEEFPLKFTRHTPGEPKQKINYYDIILKEKYK